MTPRPLAPRRPPASGPAPAVDLAVDGSRAVRGLGLVMAWLAFMVVALDVWLHLLGAVPSDDLRRLFDSTSERGLGSWVAVTQTALIALTLWGMAAVYGRLGAPPRRRWAWVALAAFFSYLAFDDATYFHERVGTAFADSAASDGRLGAFPSYYWQVLFGPFFVAAGTFMAVFLWREFRSARLRRLVGGAFALLAFAVALDFVDGLGTDHPLNLNARLADSWAQSTWTWVLFERSPLDTITHLSRSIEESVEIVAMTMLWVAFLLHFGSSVEGVRLQWAHPAPAGSTPARAPLEAGPTRVLPRRPERPRVRAMST